MGETLISFKKVLHYIEKNNNQKTLKILNTKLVATLGLVLTKNCLTASLLHPTRFTTDSSLIQHISYAAEHFECYLEWGVLSGGFTPSYSVFPVTLNYSHVYKDGKAIPHQKATKESHSLMSL